MKALVLGATGHIGNAVVRELLTQGYDVTAVSRRKERAVNLVDLPLEYAVGDIDTPGQIEEWVVGHDVVVDAAAPYPLAPFGTFSAEEQSPLVYASRRTQALLAAVRKHHMRLAYVGSFTTSLSPDKGVAGWQSTLVRALHPYFATKARIEAELLAATREGVPIVLVNPTLCVGPWDVKARELCVIPRLLCGEAPSAIRHLLNVIDVRDVATALVTALHTERYGEPILLSGHNISCAALFSWICELGNATPPRFSAPTLVSVATSYWTEVVLAQFGLPAPLPSLAVMLTHEHRWLTPSPEQRALGLHPRPLSVTLVDAISWYRLLGYC